MKYGIELILGSFLSIGFECKYKMEIYIHLETKRCKLNKITIRFVC
jgi:hypothetical protein